MFGLTQKALPNKALDIIAFVQDNHSLSIIQSSVSINTQTNLIQKGSIQNIIVYLKESPSPKILFIDIDHENLPLNKMEELAEVTEPGVHVIALGTRNDVGFFRELLSLGVSDYLVKPISKELIEKTINRLLQRGQFISQKEKRGRLILFLGTKPILGTSHLAFYTAWSLSQIHHKNTLLIDLDPYISPFSLWAHMSNIQETKHIFDHADGFDALMLKRSIVPVNSKLSLLSSLHLFDQDFTINSNYIELITNYSKMHYHYIIIHIPHFMFSTLAFLKDQTQKTICVSDYSLQSLRDLIRLKELDLHFQIALNQFAPEFIAPSLFKKKLNHAIDFEIKLNPYKAEEEFWHKSITIPKTLHPLIDDIGGWGSSRTKTSWFRKKSA
jgi:pilus assembly protein CpaE